jgi:hypothetical protein
MKKKIIKNAFSKKDFRNFKFEQFMENGKQYLKFSFDCTVIDNATKKEYCSTLTIDKLSLEDFVMFEEQDKTYKAKKSDIICKCKDKILVWGRKKLLLQFPAIPVNNDLFTYTINDESI